MKKKKLKEWALLAEVISGVAILLTLVFLVLEIRTNSELIRIDSFDRNIQSLIDFRMSVIADPASLEVMAAYFGDSPEASKKTMLVNSLWNLYEKTYYARVYDTIGMSEWGRFEYSICDNFQRDPEFWHDSVARLLTSEFREYVIATCPSDDK